MVAVHLSSGGRYPVLRTLGILYLVGAGLMIVGGALGVGWCLFAAPQSLAGRLILALSVSAATFFGVLMLLAIAELTKLAIDIEQNTRMAAIGKQLEAGDHPAENIQPAGGRLAKWLEGEETAEGALMRGH